MNIIQSEFLFWNLDNIMRLSLIEILLGKLIASFDIVRTEIRLLWWNEFRNIPLDCTGCTTIGCIPIDNYS